MSELQRLYDFARCTAHEAGVLTRGFYARRIEPVAKADGSPVTEADRQAEAFVRREIEAAFPEHGIFGEEYGVKDPAAGCPYQWYIDPIDGTKSFIHGAPLYSTLLALAREGESVIGIIVLPALDEMLAAADGMGAHLNGRPVRVSSVDKLEDALVSFTDFMDLEREAPRPGWRALFEGCNYSRGWCDAYGHLMVASGRAEIMIDPVVSPYDIAPMPVILREAGGAFIDWDGKPGFNGGNGISVNAALEPAVREALGIG